MRLARMRGMQPALGSGGRGFWWGHRAAAIRVMQVMDNDDLSYFKNNGMPEMWLRWMGAGTNWPWPL